MAPIPLLIFIGTCLFVGCTSGVGNKTSWYRATGEPHDRFYTTTKPITWHSSRKNADFGSWQAYSVYDGKPYIRAQGAHVFISAGYGWDGVTCGYTDVSMLMPSLFHDALLHAYMNGAPVKRRDIDLAFYDLMTTMKISPWRKRTYFRFARIFGGFFTKKANPPNLRIVHIPPQPTPH